MLGRRMQDAREIALKRARELCREFRWAMAQEDPVRLGKLRKTKEQLSWCRCELCIAPGPGWRPGYKGPRTRSGNKSGGYKNSPKGWRKEKWKYLRYVHGI